MIVSTTPLSERPDWHPVHRANAMLRSALLNETAFFPKPGLTQPFDAIAGTPDGPVGIAYPQSLVARLNALDFGVEGTSGIRVPLSVRATEPPPPPLFVMTHGWPRIFSAVLARIRVATSGVNPGVKPTKILIGLVGNCWANDKAGTKKERIPNKRTLFLSFHPLSFI